MAIQGSTPNQSLLPLLPPSVSQDQMIQILNNVITQLNLVTGILNAQSLTQTWSDGTNPRMLIGYQLNGWGAGNNFGMKMSIPGVDVTVATTSQLLFQMSLTDWIWYSPSTHLATITIDNTGGITTAGSATIQTAGGNIIDTIGLNSLVNFPSGTVQQSAAFSTGSTSPVVVTGMSLSFTLSRSTKAFFYTTANITATTTVALLTLMLDGTTHLKDIIVDAGFSGNISLETIASVATGSHTIGFFISTFAGGTIAVKADPAEIGYIILGS